MSFQEPTVKFTEPTEDANKGDTQQAPDPISTSQTGQDGKNKPTSDQPTGFSEGPASNGAESGIPVQVQPKPSQNRKNKKKGCCSRCCACTCGCLRHFLCKEYSWMIWMLFLLAILMLLHLILLEGCGIDTLKFEDISKDYDKKPVIAFVATLVYFLYFMVVCVCYIFGKTCCVPVDRHKTCTCKEVKLAIHLLFGALLACYILTMTKLPDSKSGGEGGGAVGGGGSGVEGKGEGGGGRRVERSPKVEGNEKADSDNKDDGGNGESARSGGQTDFGSDESLYKPNLPRKPNVPDFSNMDCIGYCHLYTILLLLMGTAAFVIFSMERRRRRQAAFPQGANHQNRPAPSHKSLPQLSSSTGSRLRNPSGPQIPSATSSVLAKSIHTAITEIVSMSKNSRKSRLKSIQSRR